MSHIKIPTIKKVEKVLGPATTWAGRCYEIACACVDRKLVQGTAVYGHWLGPVAKGSRFDRGAPFVQHGWVLLDDGRIFDATRWVFEGKDPYLYVGPADHYDEGGNEWREALAGSAPCWDPDDDQYKFDKRVLPSSDAWKFIEKLFGLDRHFDDDRYEVGCLSKRQVFFLANVSPQKLGPHALPIFQALCKLDQAALIPIDNLRRVERENGVDLT